MTQLPSGLSTRPESFAPSGESSLRLQRAVESLNLNLDDELYRYRQSRLGQGTVPATPARLQLRQTRKPIDLIALKTAAGAKATATATAPSPPPNARLQASLGQASVSNSQAYPPQATVNQTAVNQVRLSHGGTLTTYRQAPEDYLKSTEALLGSLPLGAPPQPEEEASTPTLLQQLTTPLGVGALLFLLVGSASLGYLVTSPEAVQHLSDHPITRRFKGESAESETTADSFSSQSLDGQASTGFRPLGPDLSEQEFMSLDLSNISSLPAGNTAASRPSLSVQAPAEEGQAQVEEQQTLSQALAPTARPVAPTAASGSSAVVRAEIVQAPGAAASPAPTRSNPRQTAPAAPTTTQATSAPVAVAPSAPPAAQTAPPAAIAQPPRPLALDRVPAPPAPIAPPAPVAPPAPLTQAPPQATPSYYVVTDYSGAQSLESARSVVSDAYVRNFSSGTRIQMGAFSQESSARSLVNQLQNQGIPAQVISP
jgi:hypothetical protein